MLGQGTEVVGGRRGAGPGSKKHGRHKEGRLAGGSPYVFTVRI